MADGNTKNRVKEITDKLEQGVKDIFSSGAYADYLKTMSRFHNYSTRNTLLIHMQKPEATYVAGFRKWETEFTRYVKKGERGIQILAPTPFTVKEERQKLDPDTRRPILDADGLPEVEEVERHLARFKVIHVFDVSQTDGKPLPTLVQSITGDVSNYALFMDALRGVSPLPIVFEPMEADKDGYCEMGVKIAIREGMSEVQTVSAVIHEITHAKLHDLELLRLADENAQRKDRRTEEVEAESVSYAVSQNYGIETGANSFGYVAEWSKGRDLKELNASLDIIRKTAAELIDEIDGKYRELAKERGVDLTVDAEITAESRVAVDRVVVSEPEKTPEGQRYSEELFRNSRSEVYGLALRDAEFQAALSNEFIEPDKLYEECDAVIARTVTRLFPEKLELFAFYNGDAGFKLRLIQSIFEQASEEARQKREQAKEQSEPSEPIQDTRQMAGNSPEHRLFEKFTEMFPQITSGEYSYMRLESEGFEPLSVEWIGENRISVMHTYTMNGDLMYDPMIEFEVDREARTMTAAAFEQSMPPTYQRVEENGDGFSVDGNGHETTVFGLQRKINDFAAQWFNNIGEQGYIAKLANREIEGDTVRVTFDMNGDVEPPATLEIDAESAERHETVLDGDGSEHTVYFNENNKPFWIGLGHMGNGLTVWNRLEERDGDYVTVAHIGPDRTVKFYEDDLPKAVRELIEYEARTSDMRVSATQDWPVFDAPPMPDAAEYALEYHEIPVYGVEVYNENKEQVANVRDNGVVQYSGVDLPQNAVDEIETYAKETAARREAEFLNANGDAYGVYLFDNTSGNARIIKENYRLAYFAPLGGSDTLDTIRAEFAAEDQPRYEFIPRENGKRFGTGDIIVMKQGGEVTAWFIDLLAFSKQNGFFTPEQVREEKSRQTTLDLMRPDPLTTAADRDAYGYTDSGMLPMSTGRAVELFDTGQPVYLLYPDNTEALAYDRDEIRLFDGLCGIERGDWENSPVFAAQKAIAANSQASRESELLYGTDNPGMFGIYQIRDGIDESRDFRFAPMRELEAHGLTADRANYELVYTAPLDIRDTQTNLHKIFEDFNVNHPADYTARSVSVSDVIVLQWRGDISAHYVDSAGFVELPVFTGDETPKAPVQETETYSQVGNTFTHSAPSVAQLEGDVKAGQSISISELAKAVNAENKGGPGNSIGGVPRDGEGRQAPKHKEKPSLLGRLDDKKAFAATQQPGGGSPAHTKNREV